MEVTTIGIDLAKNVFAVCGADSSARVVIRRQVRRAQVLGFMRGLPRCAVGRITQKVQHLFIRVAVCYRRRSNRLCAGI
jgi:transposase